MNNPHRARFWGIKAAQAGLSEKSNPYQTADNRQAWIAGYRQTLKGADTADAKHRAFSTPLVAGR